MYCGWKTSSRAHSRSGHVGWNSECLLPQAAWISKQMRRIISRLPHCFCWESGPKKSVSTETATSKGLRQRKKAEPPSREEPGHPALCDRSENDSGLVLTHSLMRSKAASHRYQARILKEGISQGWSNHKQIQLVFVAGNVYLTLHPDVYAMRHRHWHQKVFIQFFVELQTELDTGTNQTETKLQAPPSWGRAGTGPRLQKKADKKPKYGNHMSKKDLPGILSCFPIPGKKR